MMFLRLRLHAAHLLSSDSQLMLVTSKPALTFPVLFRFENNHLKLAENCARQRKIAKYVALQPKIYQIKSELRYINQNRFTDAAW